jgi:E3 ubiquitin-protein ligase UBR4
MCNTAFFLLPQGLICLLTRNNTGATEHLNRLLYSKITTALAAGNEQGLVGSVRHEMTLLAAIVRQQDACWESRLRTVVRLFIEAARRGGHSPAIMDAVTLPCLNILQEVSTAASSGQKRSKTEGGKGATMERPILDIRSWLAGRIDFRAWTDQLATSSSSSEQANQRTLMRKYFARWRSETEERIWRRANSSLEEAAAIQGGQDSYLKQILFNPSSRAAREVAAALVQNIMEHGPHARRVALMDTLTAFLAEVGRAPGEASQEFMALYRRLVASGEWHYYLAVKGVLTQLAGLIEAEIAYFGHLEQTRLGSDLALGFAVKQLTGLLASLLEQGRLKAAYKSRLVSAVLGGYLSLRRLVIQRTKMVDETQDSLLALLEDLTTGTEEETRAFMRCCVDTLGRYPPDDHLTPVFIFERLCSLIYPEEADTGEFLLVLEKDPQQEEFLQGRMLGNPYSSREPGLGPLMREIKNKICMDCELVALLEDDNGMELLVNNKIISLDLPVKEVYQRIWLPEAGEAEPMRVVYRMRGLLGDATEEFIESLDKKEGEASDDEMTYALASVLGECGGLKVP